VTSGYVSDQTEKSKAIVLEVMIMKANPSAYHRARLMPWAKKAVQVLPHVSAEKIPMLSVEVQQSMLTLTKSQMKA
jgi:hypothetical protein